MNDVTWVLYVMLAAVVIILFALWYVWRKGRRFTAGDVFRASRMSKGNRLFPTQVAITPQAVIHYTPQWVGRLEHSIHMAHVASVSIETNLMFSNVLIETTGGHSPIHCRGHHKRDAVKMKELIEQHQSAYYRSGGGDRSIGGGAAGPGGGVAARRGEA